MSVFGKLSGGGKGENEPTLPGVIQRLKQTEAMLARKQEFLEKKIDMELKTVKKNKRGEWEKTHGVPSG